MEVARPISRKATMEHEGRLIEILGPEKTTQGNWLVQMHMVDPTLGEDAITLYRGPSMDEAEQARLDGEVRAAQLR